MAVKPIPDGYHTITIFAHDQALVLACQIPNGRIRCAAMPQQPNVQRVRKDVGQRLAQLLRQRLIKEEPGHFRRRVC
jgi:hypothetical protein